MNFFNTKQTVENKALRQFYQLTKKFPNKIDSEKLIYKTDTGYIKYDLSEFNRNLFITFLNEEQRYIESMYIFFNEISFHFYLVKKIFKNIQKIEEDQYYKRYLKFFD